MDQIDPWQVVPRQVFTPYSRLLISAALVVVSRVGCLGVTAVIEVLSPHDLCVNGTYNPCSLINMSL